MSGLNLVFAGTPAFGLPCLDAIAQSEHQLKAIYTQPDRPAGRGRKLQSSAVKLWALDHNIPVYQPLHLKDAATLEALASLKPDVLVVIAYGLILPKSILTIPRFGCINVHASLLPAWRGASPIQQAILHGDAVTGVTIMQMDAGMDTGDMLEKVICPIDESDSAASLTEKLAGLSTHPLLKVLDELQSNTIIPEKQKDALVSLAPKIQKEDAEINWSSQAAIIGRQIRAYNPWPVAYTQAGTELVRIHQASLTKIPCSSPPGTILNIDKKGISVATADVALTIERLQFSGGKAICVADWLNTGKKQLYKGLRLG